MGNKSVWLWLYCDTDLIASIYKEIGPGRRVALSKLSVEHYIAHSRPLRLAIDISIWLFQIQAGQGGSNPALRTFYYRLLRLLSLNIHPLFVFDGPNKPLFKRNKRVGGPGVKVSSVPEFLAKQLLKQFGFPMHIAPGEAEAECALLQREGIVDAVLSEDVDTLMFGSGLTIRNWSSEMKSSKVPTHVNAYDARVTKEGSGLDREGMVLIALMSGGDYIPEGIPGCGPKVACEAARAGFGADLCKIRRKDTAGFAAWRDRLRHELSTNESKFFRQKRKALVIPDDFPNVEVLGYYTHPCVSTPEKLERLREMLKWDMPIDYPALRSFAADAFDWRCIGGAKKFVRNLAPAVLIRDLRLRAETGGSVSSAEIAEEEEAKLIIAIHGKRNHVTTDKQLELRVSFTPINLINIDLSIEEPDEEFVAGPSDSDGEAAIPNDTSDKESECPVSPRKRGPSKYDPTIMEKVWVLDTFLKLGVPLKVQDWEASFRDPKNYIAMKQAAKNAGKAGKPKATKKAGSGMQRGALDRFTKVTKPGIVRPEAAKRLTPEFEEVDLSAVNELAESRPIDVLPRRRSPRPNPLRAMPAKDRIEEVDLSIRASTLSPLRRSKRGSSQILSPRPARNSVSKEQAAQPTVIDLLSSSPVQAPTKQHTPTPLDMRPFVQRAAPVAVALFQPDIGIIDLPDTVNKRRRKKSPLKRYQSAPTTGEDLSPILRPSTPPLYETMDTIEAIDLASPLAQKSSPFLPPHPSRRAAAALNVTSGAMKASEIASPSRLPPPRDIVEWIRRSQSVTPSKARHANFLGRGEVDDGHAVPVSLLTPPSEKDEESIGAGNRGLHLSPDLPESPVLRRSSREQGADDRMRAPLSKPKNTRTRFYVQPRESLEGAWKMAEAVDLTSDVTRPRPGGSKWRRSAVEILDLTED
ncbi:hypothetical protein M8818_001279 [Zalaria obscura]|uniref:Uncharacterized protein n=1 Tax=Zalaria obscura TaxID=2024903 RepID=A0ACC3SKQ3_9PEZI